ncbi:hypothetical protein BFJ71_g278 [Fusarium oxysporum]|nr:hypothetical protein BFJ71_g278 [Fusarium oxysporum]
MADLDKRNAKKNSELIRQGIVQCLTLEAECEALRGSLAESQGDGQKLEARIAEMIADREGLMKILAEKDTLIERYNALMSETLDKTLRRERQDLRDDEAKVLLASEQDIDVEMDKKDKKALGRDSLLEMAREAAIRKPRKTNQ